MTVIENHLATYQFHRQRTLGLLDEIQQHNRGSEALGWRPGAGRAHMAWQLMHIGVTEELFATERLRPEKEGAFQELWPRFRGGSTPDDNIPAADEIRSVLAQSREHLTATLQSFDDGQLDDIAFPQRNWTLRTVLQVIGWHESHHHGQAHLTWNLFQNQ